MLACTALVVGCADDVIENGAVSQKQPELVRGDAYVSFVINTSTNSSRGTTTAGDTHPNAEDNKHHVAGVETENTVNELLLVIAKVNDESATNDLYTEVMTEAEKQVANGYVGYPAFTATGTSIKMNAPIRLDYTGKYKVLAVINPADDLKAKITEGGNHKAAYEAILAHEGTAAYKTITKEGKEELSFQMSNQSECLIEAKVENNVPTNPVVASIAVERTTSKTTWRPTNAIPEGVTIPATLEGKENLYAVKVNVGKATAEIANYWFKDVLTSTTEGNTATYDAFYYGYQLNKAKHTDGKFYWVLLAPGFAPDEGGKIDANDVTAIFEDAFYTKDELDVLDDEDNYTGVIDDQTLEWTDDAVEGTDDKLASIIGSEETAKVLKDSYKDAKDRATDAFIQGLTFVYPTMSNNDADATHYFVNLTHYALTNLADKVYAVRHTDGGIMKALTNDWLLTPALTYGNTLAEVNKAAAALTSTNIDSDKTFKPLPTSASRNDGIANDELKEGETATTHDDKAVGYFMEYLMENAPKAPTTDNITGIVLAGNIYDNTGALVPVLYKYNQKYYRSLRALVNANPNLTYKVEGVETPVNLTENSTNDQAKAAGVDVYEKGRCFYYSSGIKHVDDGSAETSGVMEYAIMRNNIYSLAVNGVTEIGDAQLTLTQSTPIEDIRAYVTLEVSILPWIVRFNDIEL